MRGNVASWKAVKIPLRLKNQEREKMAREETGEVGRDKAMKPCSRGEEFSCLSSQEQWAVLKVDRWT